MAHEVKIHDAQTLILRELLFRPSAGFADLQKTTGLDSDHFKFHIKKVVDLGYVEKMPDGDYCLTVAGKEHANKLDTDTNTIERQPKVSVILIVHNQDDPEKTLVQQRLKNPFYGYWGRVGGKVRWGETFEEAASRELEEETGLVADFAYRMTYRKIDYAEETRELLEDKVFIVLETYKYSGTFLEEFEGGRNAWMTYDELIAVDKHFGSATDFIELLESGLPYVCRKYYTPGSDY